MHWAKRPRSAVLRGSVGWIPSATVGGSTRPWCVGVKPRGLARPYDVGHEPLRLCAFENTSTERRARHTGSRMPLRQTANTRRRTPAGGCFLSPVLRRCFHRGFPHQHRPRTSTSLTLRATFRPQPRLRRTFRRLSRPPARSLQRSTFLRSSRSRDFFRSPSL